MLFVALSAGAQQASAPSSAEPAAAAAAKPSTAPRKIDRAAAYYHYTLAHLYEEQVAMYGRSELVTKAIEEYRHAIVADHTS